MKEPQYIYMEMSSILLKICVYLGCIYLLHQLYQYITSQLVIPTKRNMIQLHQETYNEILEQLKPNSVTSSSSQEIQSYHRQEEEEEELHILTDEQKQYLKQSLQCQLNM